MNPYQALHEELHVTLVFEHLPAGERGRYYPDLDLIVIDRGLNQKERRSTLMHELVHRMLGHEPTGDERLDARQEKACEEEAARLLIPLVRLADAHLWGKHPSELAEELWVDVDTLRTRVMTLNPWEKDYINRRLQDQDWGAA